MNALHQLTLPALAIGLATIAPCSAQSGIGGRIVINEFSYDDSGSDDMEFVELYNAGAIAVDIGDWHVDGIDANGGPDSVATIPTGTMLAAGDFYVIGQAAVPNLDLDITANSDWQNSTEALTLYDATDAIIDTLVYEVSTDGALFDPTLAEGDDGIWASQLSVTRGGVLFWSVSRCSDGLDTDRNGYDFRAAPASPGTSNNLAAPSSVDSYDTTAVAAPLNDWLGSFTDPVSIDPTVIDGNNLNAIVASPGGGNAGVFWDPSGGGNVNVFRAGCCENLVFEAYCYFEAAALGDPTNTTDEVESWSIGFGTEGYRYNDPDPAGIYGFTRNGNAGVSWTYQRREVDGMTVLYLMDHNDGGVGPGAVSGPTVLGQIVIQAGINDGWQRLRLEKLGTQVVGRFGGTYGSVDDGTALRGMTGDAPMGLWCGYREFISDNSTARPITLDDVSIRCCDNLASVQLSPGCPAGLHGLGGPALSFGGVPTVGSTFTIDASNLAGSPLCGLFLGTASTPVPLSLIGSTVPGAQLCVTPFFTAPCSGGVGGTASFSLPLPLNLNSCGISIDVQWIDYFGTGFDIGSSQAGRFTIGS